jgi:uncharacterized protein (DUF58 family)
VATTQRRSRRRGLTRRGWLFAGVGLLCLLAGLLGGGDGWQRVGLLLLALPLLSLLLVVRTRLGLVAHREVDPGRVPVDQETTVALSLRSTSFVPAGMLRLEDAVPGAGSRRPRFVIDRGGPRWTRQLTYRLRPRHRGLMTIGPLTVHVEDPFGMVHGSRRLADVTTVVVTPTVRALPAIRIPGEWSGSGESRPRSVAAAGEEDATVRPYQRGDDRRRVHWRATARHGELMVRREEQPWQSRATLVLDTRTAAHGQRPEGRRTPATSSLEWSVAAAASVGVHLLERGYAVRLVTDEGGSASTAWHDRGEGPGSAEATLLEALATVSASNDASIGRIRALLHGAGTSSRLLVAVLGRLTADEVAGLARLRHDTSAALALLVDADKWGPGPGGGPGSGTGQTRPLPPEAAAAILRRAGWHVATVSPSGSPSGQPALDDLVPAWSTLGDAALLRAPAPPAAVAGVAG